MSALHLVNARTICPIAGEQSGDLLIVDGVIADDLVPENAVRVDCGGKLVLPGTAIDTVITRAAPQRIVAPIAIQQVVAVAAI